MHGQQNIKKKRTVNISDVLVLSSRICQKQKRERGLPMWFDGKK
jgi:hypothetical protein